MPFYAVKKGRNPGIYDSWSACEAQVKGFKGPVFRKFSTRVEAVEFVGADTGAGQPSASPHASNAVKALKTSGLSPVAIPRLPRTVNRLLRTQSCSSATTSKRGITTTADDHGLQNGVLKKAKYSGYGARKVYSENSYDSDENILAAVQGLEDCIDGPETTNDAEISREDFVTVYTDGACVHNGKVGSKAGIGVYFGPGHPYNLSERLLGRQTNNRAEIIACCRALEQVIAMDRKAAHVYTDSAFMINCMTKWIDKWKKNGWRVQSKEDVVNKEELQRLDMLCSQVQVRWFHVRGHRGIMGNEEADRLAREGIAKR